MHARFSYDIHMSHILYCQTDFMFFYHHIQSANTYTTPIIWDAIYIFVIIFKTLQLNLLKMPIIHTCMQ